MAPRAAPPAGRTNTGPKTSDERWAAVHAARAAGGLAGPRLAEAKRLYHLMAPHSTPTKFKQFATRWHRRAAAGKPLHDAPRGGRPPKLTRQQVYTIATEWTQGTVGRGIDKRPYRSMVEVRPAAGQRQLSRCRSRPLRPPPEAAV